MLWGGQCRVMHFRGIVFGLILLENCFAPLELSGKGEVFYNVEWNVAWWEKKHWKYEPEVYFYIGIRQVVNMITLFFELGPFWKLSIFVRILLKKVLVIR